MSEETPWATGSPPGEKYEDMLIGNRQGLTKLKEAIEKAIADGQVDIEDAGIEFNGIRLLDKDPREPFSRWGQLTAGLVFFAVAILAILGLWKVADLFR